ncbi:MAG TPA: hypothetical protein VJK02_10775 [Anaerolineales bacterium]|nr:hypothetical protein [Anaerolineales bacterium]
MKPRLCLLLFATILSTACGSAPIPEERLPGRVLVQGFVEGSFELAVLDFDSGSKTTLTNRQVISPTSFSYDSAHSRVVFSAPAESGQELFLISPETEPWRVLTKGGNRFNDPRWSPDGRRLAFNSRTDEGRYEILLTAADGTDARRLLNESVAARDPMWSADGTLIAALLLSTEPQNEEDFTGIGIIEVSSGELTRFATNPLDHTFSTLAWSTKEPNLTFSAMRGQSLDLFMLDAEAGDTKSLADTDADEWSGVWSPDGSKLAYIASSSENALTADVVVLDFVTSSRNIVLEDQPSISSVTWLNESTLLLGVYDLADSATVFYALGLGHQRMVEQGKWAGMYFDPVPLP